MTETRAPYNAGTPPQPAHREIKFRAFLAGKMVYDVGVMPNNGDIKTEWLEGRVCVRPGVAPLMQFTGLKDRSGREIYEGDIVSSSGYDPLEVCFDWIGCVGDEGNSALCWYVKSRKFIFPISDDFEENKFEVIGNIHENKELLK